MRPAPYDLGDDELFYARGAVVDVLTVVPLGRVQHIDIAQGLIERRFGLARLIVHTSALRLTIVMVRAAAIGRALWEPIAIAAGAGLVLGTGVAALRWRAQGYVLGDRVLFVREGWPGRHWTIPIASARAFAILRGP